MSVEGCRGQRISEVKYMLASKRRRAQQAKGMHVYKFTNSIKPPEEAQVASLGQLSVTKAIKLSVASGK